MTTTGADRARLEASGTRTSRSHREITGCALVMEQNVLPKTLTGGVVAAQTPIE